MDRASAGGVIRGGAWYDVARNVRAVYRDRLSSGDRDFGVGFRCRVCELPAQHTGERRSSWPGGAIGESLGKEDN